VDTEVATLTGVFAATHTPVMLNFPDAVSADDRNAVYASFKDLGRRIAAARPQAIIIAADDHLHNFFLNNLPAFCIGAANDYETPIEPWLKARRRRLPGNAALGAHLIGEAYAAGFDPALSMELILDHGMLTPLELAGVPGDIPVVPLLVNCVQPPLPTMQRCLQWGQFIRQAVASFEGVERVCMLGTGGLSHDVGTPRMGMINEAFDKEFLRLLSAGSDAELARFSTDHVNSAGNGTEEIRMWLIARGAAGAGAAFDAFFYRPLTTWYTGVGLAEWRPQQA
jgi:aromatic ring-opening dioxygenase catalytic subunit (LigB family)